MPIHQISNGCASMGTLLICDIFFLFVSTNGILVVWGLVVWIPRDCYEKGIPRIPSHHPKSPICHVTHPDSNEHYRRKLMGREDDSFTGYHLGRCEPATFRECSISHLGKRKHLFKTCQLWKGDMREFLV